MPIVGIGASAGGLAAFEEFFSGMPADAELGMAFVFVQHLAPDHKSILSELVRRYTSLKEAFLAKPYPNDALRRAIRRALGKGKP